MSLPLQSIPGVATVEWVRGRDHAPETPARLLVEVPHGAFGAADYQRCRARLQGALPADLDAFFHVNTDVGAYEIGRAAALEALAARPTEAALLIRCQIPRTFIDTNRNLGGGPPATGAQGGGGGRASVTQGLPVYITDPADQATLLDLHAAYVDLTDRAYAALADADGFALVPHTYAPRTVGIDRVDHDIVDRLRAAWAPGVAETWPLRHPVDLITRDGAGARLCPKGAAEELTAAYGALDIEAAENGTYWLHPATRAALLSSRYPGRLLCLELRRDLVVQRWTPLLPLTVDPAAARRLGAPIGACLARLLASG